MMLQAVILLGAVLFSQANCVLKIDACDEAAHGADTQLVAAESDMLDADVSDSTYDPFLSTNFTPYYFSHLKTNYGKNQMGSCTFVAIEMLLTFYDTYWDDGIVDDSYMTKSTMESGDPGSFIGIESPGATADPEFSDTNDVDSYEQFVDDNDGVSLHYLLLNIGESLFGDLPGSEPSTAYAITFDEAESVIGTYLTRYGGYNLQQYATAHRYRWISSNMRSYVITKLKDDQPVILRIKVEDGYHAVIAYDYDEDNDEIYVHSGWGGEYTHNDYPNYAIPLSAISIDGETIYETIVLDLYTSHTCSDNYQYVDDDADQLEGSCICTSYIPWDVDIQQYYLDQLPTFIWSSLSGGTWFDYQYPAYTISFVNTSGRVILELTDLSGNSVTLTESQMATLVKTSGTLSYMKIEADGVLGPLCEGISYQCELSTPDSFSSMIRILPSEWGMEARYWFESEGIRYTWGEYGGVTFSTSRLRCGYIEDRYVVLSPRREDAGEAYFQISYSHMIYSFMYSALWWSSSEYAESASILIQDYMGNWTEVADLMDKDLPEGGSYPYREVLYFPQGAVRIKFVVTAEATGDRNKGRLCIDDLGFGTSKNELEYFHNDYKSTYLWS